MNQYKFEKGFNVRFFIIIFSVLLIISYGIFNARDLLMGPIVEIINPSSDTETKENTFTIKGWAKNIAFISLNEKPISVDTEGLFEEKLLLSPGSNIIEIKAKDRFKKEVLKTIKIYYKQGPVSYDTEQGTTTSVIETEDNQKI